MLGKRQVRAIFLFKMCYKTEETTHDINNVFGPETANEHISAEVVKMKWEPWRWGVLGWLSEADNNRQDHQSWRSYNHTRSRWRTQRWPVYNGLGRWSKLERWKSLISRRLISWWQIKKFILKCHHLLSNKPFLNGIVTWDKQWILYDNWWQPIQ